MANLFHNFSLTTKRRWGILIGSASDFTLQTRIFHSISLGITLLAIAYLPYDLFAGLYIAALSCIILGGIFFYEYYRSRFLGREHRSLLFGIIGLLILSVNYFANSGIEGSTDLIWPVYLLLLLTICPYRHMISWVIIYLVVFGLVHLAEHYYPELVQYPFRVGKGRFIDRITAFPIPVISMAIIIGLFRKNYDRERTAVAQRDAEKGRLLSILAHDLRAPFVQVQQYLEMLDSNLLSQDDRVHIEQALKKKNDQTLLLVTNLLYWSKSQLEGFSVKLAAQSLAVTLKNTIEIANGLARDKSIMLSINIDPKLQVLADADMLQLVVRNLLQNAIKFTASEGKISLNVEIINQNCHLSVIDNGIGIDATLIENLFSGTLPTLGTANEKGVGLGLQLCKEFMAHQNGNIWAESVSNKGSKFTIMLPLALKNS